MRWGLIDKLYTSILFAFLLSLSGKALSQVSVIAIEITGLHHKDRTGSYDIIYDEALGADAKYITLPPKRAFEAFSRCNNCCLGPVNLDEEFYDFDESVIETEFINTAKIHIFTRPETPQLDRIELLQGKRVGARWGMPYGKGIEESGLDIIFNNTIEQNIKMLDAGRIDAFIAYIPDAYTAFKDMSLEVYPHSRAKPLAIHKDSLACKGVDSQLIKKYNKKIVELRSNGYIKKVLGYRFLVN